MVYKLKTDESDLVHWVNGSNPQGRELTYPFFVILVSLSCLSPFYLLLFPIVTFLGQNHTFFFGKGIAI